MTKEPKRLGKLVGYKVGGVAYIYTLSAYCYCGNLDPPIRVDVCNRCLRIDVPLRTFNGKRL